MNKKELELSLKKSVIDLTDDEINDILNIDESMWPETNHTSLTLAQEKVARSEANKIKNEDIVQEAVYISILKQLRSMGPNVYPEMDMVGRHTFTEEINRLEKQFKLDFDKWSKQS